MRIATSLVAAVVLVTGATSAIAAPTRLSDVDFIAANRCLGLMSSKALATPDADAMRRLVKDQGGRVDYVYEKADDARRDAESEAARGGAEHLAQLTAERDGLCHNLLTTSTTAATGGGGHSL